MKLFSFSQFKNLCLWTHPKIKKTLMWLFIFWVFLSFLQLFTARSVFLHAVIFRWDIGHFSLLLSTHLIHAFLRVLPHSRGIRQKQTRCHFSGWEVEDKLKARLAENTTDGEQWHPKSKYFHFLPFDTKEFTTRWDVDPKHAEGIHKVQFFFYYTSWRWINTKKGIFVLEGI